MTGEDEVIAGTETPELTRDAYSVAEAAVRLGLCPTTTYRLVRAGEIPAKRMGGRWIVPKRRFHAWLNERPDGDEEVAL